MADILLGVLIGAYGLIALCFFLSFCFPLFVVVGESVDSPVPFPLRFLAIILGAALWPLTILLLRPTLALHERCARRHEKRELQSARRKSSDLYAQCAELRSVAENAEQPIDPEVSKRRAADAFFGLTSEK